METGHLAVPSSNPAVSSCGLSTLPKSLNFILKTQPVVWENGIETCKISCMKRVASPGSMHDTGCLGLVHWDDP